MAENLVLFGGTFDPVHHGHLVVARSLAEARGFEQVTFVPAACPPHKSAATAPPADRLAMLRLAIAEEPLLDLSDLELSRQGPSYTIDTVRELRRLHGAKTKIHWVIGADMLEDLPRWHCAAEVLAEAGLIVVVRPPWDQRLEEIFTSLMAELGSKAVNALRESVTTTPRIDISSSDIRRRLAEGRSIRFLLPDSVLEYIEDRKLYASTGTDGA